MLAEFPGEPPKRLRKFTKPYYRINSPIKKTSTAMTAENNASDKALELMKNFAEKYAQRTGTYFCVDPSVTAVVIEGLAKHKEELGAPLCPCRHYEDKKAEVDNAFWNCPCVPMRERNDCHCMLFITEDNDFAGDKQEIELDYIKEVAASLKG
jgi:ferredoxin-thioredoxin reductase catalytic chain